MKRLMTKKKNRELIGAIYQAQITSFGLRHRARSAETECTCGHIAKFVLAVTIYSIFLSALCFFVNLSW